MMQGGRVCKSFGGPEDGLIISKEDEVEEEGGEEEEEEKEDEVLSINCE